MTSVLGVVKQEGLTYFCQSGRSAATLGSSIAVSVGCALSLRPSPPTSGYTKKRNCHTSHLTRVQMFVVAGSSKLSGCPSLWVDWEHASAVGVPPSAVGKRQKQMWSTAQCCWPKLKMQLYKAVGVLQEWMNGSPLYYFLRVARKYHKLGGLKTK